MKKWQILEFDGKPYYAFVPDGDTPLPEESAEQVDNIQTKVEKPSDEDNNYDSMEERYYREEEEEEEEEEVEEEEEEEAIIEEEEEENEELDIKPILLNGESNDLYHFQVEGSVVTFEKLPSQEEEEGDITNVEYLDDIEDETIIETTNQDPIDKDENNTTTYKCKACSETFNSSLSFRKHVAWTHKKKVCIQEGGAYICAVCDYKTMKKSLFAAHLERKHETWSRKRTSNVMFPCAACGFVCRSKHSLQSHFIRKHTDRYEHQCKFCSKKFKVKGDLTNHIRFHHKEKPVNCDVCGKLCQNSGSLYVHQKWAHYKPKFECHICKRRMVTQENLDQHLLTQHEKREKIVCAECGKTFTKKDSFKRHMAVHTGCKPHSCLICNKPFARRSQLRQHLLIHTGKRPFICDICGKAFTQKPGLICHRKTHPGQHPPLPVMPIADIVKEFTEEYFQEVNAARLAVAEKLGPGEEEEEEEDDDEEDELEEIQQ